MKQGKILFNYWLTTWILLFIMCSCVSEKKPLVKSQYTELSINERMISIRGELVIDTELVFSGNVTLYPEAFLSTTGQGKIIFKGKVNVIGQTPIFDENINLEFGEGCTGTLNVGWFGARGNDDMPDTRAFQKTMMLASTMRNSVKILVPTGKYWITETLILENQASLRKSIQVVGEGMSSSSLDGSSLVWNGPPGGTILMVRNNYNNRIQSVDFGAEAGHEVKYNVDLRSQIYLMEFRDCSFSGSAGISSSNINLNEGHSDQVSEISFENCVFRGRTFDNATWLTSSAVRGGKANTKNFYFEQCSFLGYTSAAVDIEISETVHIRDCAFAHNEVDIICLLCSILISSNYSEQSKAFFKTTTSSNVAFATLLNNYFDGHAGENFVIPGGTGSLVLINNNFGGSGGDDQTNQIRWDSRNISSVFSVGNFFRNASSSTIPFQFSEIQTTGAAVLKSVMDKVGPDGVSSKKLSD